MRPVKFKFNHWFPKITGYHITAPWRTIYFANDRDIITPQTYKHELIHIQQYEQEGAWKFLFNYIKDYVTFRLQGNPHYTAYQMIRYEKEAYAKQYEPFSREEADQLLEIGITLHKNMIKE